MQVLVLRALDGDSVLVRRTDTDEEFGVRVGGVDVPSRGPKADAAVNHIKREWAGELATFTPTCCGRPHGEVPGVLKKANGANLGLELLKFGRRLHEYEIGACLPALLLDSGLHAVYKK